MRELKPTVFIVDNGTGIAASLRRLMESVRLSVETYPDVRGLLENFDATRPGCLILDVRLPEMSGLELCRRLWKAGGTLPAIFVTAYGDVPTAVQAMQEGAFDFLQEPLSEQYLLDRVHAALEKDGCDRRRAAERQAVVARFAALSPKERQVAALIVDGMASKEVARVLGITVKTVDFHKANIMRKVGVETVVELVCVFIKGGCDRAAQDEGMLERSCGDSDETRGVSGRSATPWHGRSRFRGCGSGGKAGAGIRRSGVLCGGVGAAPRAPAPLRGERA